MRRLPTKWNQKLQTLEARVVRVEASINRNNEQMEAELQKVRERYASHMQFPQRELRTLQEKIDREWNSIRNTYTMVHPHRTKQFKTYFEAAAVLAHYWQGKKMDPKELLQGISGLTTDSGKIYAEASKYATHLTAPDSPERAYVKQAENFLWKDVSR